MGGNQLNLFKFRYWDDTFTNACDGTWQWGTYVEMLQDWTGPGLTRVLTGYEYRNQHLEELYYGR